MAIVTIGSLAHVDAGKTSLTERILCETGVTPAAGCDAAYVGDVARVLYTATYAFSYPAEPAA